MLQMGWVVVWAVACAPDGTRGGDAGARDACEAHADGWETEVRVEHVCRTGECTGRASG